MENVTGISAADVSSLFLTKDGSVFGTGHNLIGQLGVEGRWIYSPTKLSFCERTRSEIEAEKEAWNETMRNDRSSFIVPILTDPPRTRE
jgi:alpha-tubulin suppressor-like RCC1 family protein